MVKRNLHYVQSSLNSLTRVQKNINELNYYKKYLMHSTKCQMECKRAMHSIESLKTKHKELVDALQLYGSAYQQIDLQLANQNNPEKNYESKNNFCYQKAPEHQKGYLERTFNHLLYGDFTEDVTLLGISGDFILGFLGLDAPMDARDLIANLKNKEYGWALLSGISLFPIIGVFGEVKPLAKGMNSLGDISTGVKNTDQYLKAGNKSFHWIGEGINSTLIHNGKEFKHVNGVFDGVEHIDEITSTYKGSDKILWQTGTKNEFILKNNTFTKIDKDGNVLYEVSNVKYIENFNYVKKGELHREVLRKEFDTIKRKEFILDLVENHETELKQLKLSDDDWIKLKKGEVPDGYEVHHKLSLDDGGDNSKDNLILIHKNDHQIFTDFQNGFSNTNNFKNKKFYQIDWIVPEGRVYINKTPSKTNHRVKFGK